MSTSPRALALRHLSISLCFLAPVASAHDSLRSRTAIQGRYIEVRERARSGRPRANETEVSPYRTTIVWRVEDGRWNAETLDGLAIVFEVRSRRDLDPSRRDPRVESRVESIDAREDPAGFGVTVHVDERASPAQSRALLSFASHSAPDLASRIDAVRPARIDVITEDRRSLVRVADRLLVAFDLHEEHGDGCTAVCARDPRPGQALARDVAIEAAHALVDPESIARPGTDSDHVTNSPPLRSEEFGSLYAPSSARDVLAGRFAL